MTGSIMNYLRRLFSRRKSAKDATRAPVVFKLPDPISLPSKGRLKRNVRNHDRAAGRCHGGLIRCHTTRFERRLSELWVPLETTTLKITRANRTPRIVVTKVGATPLVRSQWSRPFLAALRCTTFGSGGQKG